MRFVRNDLVGHWRFTALLAYAVSAPLLLAQLPSEEEPAAETPIAALHASVFCSAEIGGSLPLDPLLMHDAGDIDDAPSLIPAH